MDALILVALEYTLAGAGCSLQVKTSCEQQLQTGVHRRIHYCS